MSTIMVATDADVRECVRHRDVAADILQILDQHYPGYKWLAQPDLHNGIVNIRCGHTNCAYGYTLIPEQHFSETDWRDAVVKAGGEILERSHLNRRRLDLAEFIARPRNFAGLTMPDL